MMSRFYMINRALNTEIQGGNQRKVPSWIRNYNLKIMFQDHSL